MKTIINLIKKNFSVVLEESTENNFKCWKKEDLVLDATDYKPCFQSPVLYLDKNKTDLPTKEALENGLYDHFLASSALGGFGNASSAMIKTEDHFVLCFWGLESPLGEMDCEGNYIRDYSLSGAVTASKVENGILWGFWPKDIPGYDPFIDKICTVIGCATKDNLEEGDFKFWHEEPDCNWSEAEDFF